MENPMDNATAILQTFSHLRGTVSHIKESQRYLMSLTNQFSALGIRRPYLETAIRALQKVETKMLIDIDRFSKKLAKVNLADDE